MKQASLKTMCGSEGSTGIPELWRTPSEEQGVLRGGLLATQGALQPKVPVLGRGDHATAGSENQQGLNPGEKKGR